MKRLYSALLNVFVLAAALLVTSFVIMYLVGQEAVASHRQIGTERDVLEHLNAALATLQQAESGERGFLLTGEEAYLDPYRAALAKIRSELQDLRRLAVQGDLPADAVQAVLTLSQEKLEQMEQDIKARRNGGLPAALPLIKDGIGKATMDKLRIRVGEMTAAEDAKLGAALQHANWTIVYRTGTFVAMALSYLAFLAWAYRRIGREIRAREEAVLERNRQNELLATTLASIGDAVIATDSGGKITFLNREAERLTGWSVAEAAGQPLTAVFRIINEASGQPADNPVDKVLRLGTVVGLANHTLLVRKDGFRVPIDDSAAPIRQREGGLFGVVLVFRDCTSQRQAEETQARLAAIVQFSGDAIFTEDLEGRIQTWNAGAERLFGYTAEEVLGKPITILLPPERPDEDKQMVENLQAGERTQWLETVRVAKDGRQVPVAVSVSRIQDSDGRLIGASKIIHDITEQKCAEAALRESEAQFRQLADAMPQIVWTAQPDGYIDYFNERWYEFTGFERGQFGQSSWEPILHPEDVERCVTTWADCIRQAKPYQIEYRFKDRASAGYRWFMGRALPVRNERGEVVRWFGTCTDIDEQKRAAERLEQIVAQRTARLREMVRELQHVSYAMVHDMRAPLRAMQAFAQLLAAGAPEETPEQRQEYLQRIMTSASRLDKLVQDGLNYNRAVLEERPLKPVALEPLLQDLVRTYPNLDATRADIQIDGPLPVVVGNESLLTQCFANLLGNAVKFVAEGVRPHVHIRAEAAPPQDRAATAGPEAPANHRVRIWIEDNGIGIPRAAQKRLFGMFQKLDNKYDGTGVGLAIVRKVTERMGGRVGAESEAGQGSRFWVELALAESDRR